MIHALLEKLAGLPPQLITVFLGALPISEVRGAIPVGMVLGLPLREAFLWACLGNLLPVIPLLLFLDPVAARLRRFRFWKGFFEWFFKRTARKADLVQRYEALGLALFVAVPLPFTGAWTGCAAASLFKLPFRIALPAVAAGIIGAAVLVSLAVCIGLRLFFTF